LCSGNFVPIGEAVLRNWLTYLPLLYVMSAGLVFAMRSWGWLMIAAISTLAASAFLVSASERVESDIGWLGITAAIFIAAGVVIGAAARSLHLLMPKKAGSAMFTMISVLLIVSPLLGILLNS
jgi:hypothetical protein